MGGGSAGGLYPFRWDWMGWDEGNERPNGSSRNVVSEYAGTHNTHRHVTKANYVHMVQYKLPLTTGKLLLIDPHPRTPARFLSYSVLPALLGQCRRSSIYGDAYLRICTSAYVNILVLSPPVLNTFSLA